MTKPLHTKKLTKESIKGFKAFDKGLKCRGFQFEEGKTYKTEIAKVCSQGFHLCTNPFDLLNYYDISESEFATAEALGEVDKCTSDSKLATTKIKIGLKIGLPGFVKACVEFILDITKPQKTEKVSDTEALNDNGVRATQIGASGDSTQIGASGHSTKIGASGDSTHIGASGHYTHIGASGDSTQIGASGDSTQIGASGDSTQIGASGHYTHIGASGHYTKIGASGHYTKIELNGKDSVGMCAGHDSKIKGKIGNWITLSEWEYDSKKGRYIPLCVKSAQIDGETLKEDVWYKLIDGKFQEVK